MGEKISKAMLDDLVSRGAKVGRSMAESMDGPTIVQTRNGPVIGDWSSGTFADKAGKFTPTETAGIWTFRIPNWSPTPLNKILYAKHWTTGSKRKKNDGEIVAYYGRGVPKASGKRAVSLHVVFPPGKRQPDVDAFWKSALDSLVACGLLVNDSDAWACMNPVQYSRGQELVTFITVEDV